jgi:hypothetical protein
MYMSTCGAAAAVVVRDALILLEHLEVAVQAALPRPFGSALSTQTN